MDDGEMKRFDTKIDVKVLRALSAMFDNKNARTEEETVKMEKCAVISRDNVFMVVALSEEAKRTISRFLPTEAPKIPDLNYTDDALRKNTPTSKFGTEYLKLFVNLLIASGESALITIAHNYPGTFENEHFKIICAPRTDRD